MEVKRVPWPCRLTPEDMFEIDEGIKAGLAQVDEDEEQRPQIIIQGHSVGKPTNKHESIIIRHGIRYKVEEAQVQDIAYGYNLAEPPGDDQTTKVYLASASAVDRTGRVRTKDLPVSTIDQLRAHLDHTWDGIEDLGTIVGRGAKRAVREVLGSEPLPRPVLVQKQFEFSDTPPLEAPTRRKGRGRAQYLTLRTGSHLYDHVVTSTSDVPLVEISDNLRFLNVKPIRGSRRAIFSYPVVLSAETRERLGVSGFTYAAYLAKERRFL